MTGSNSIKIWNANTSILTVLIYIIYAVVYRLNLNDTIANIAFLLTIINIILIFYNAFLLFKFRQKMKNLSKDIAFICLRTILNITLIFLIVDYL